MATATGVGSWPGDRAREAVRTVRDIVVGEGLPYLPETPGRGPGADIIGRGAALLVDLAVDLQPMGWRLVDRPGRDLARARALHTEDLDELAEAYDGYSGRLKVQVAGPWTLAASMWLPRGERVLTDPGARRDLVESLAAGLGEYLSRVGRAVPLADLVVQLDEPSLTAVLGGTLPTASGYGTVRAVEATEVHRGLRAVLGAAPGTTVVHCCAGDPPMPVLRDSGADVVSLDTRALRERVWEGIAVAVEAGTTLAAGCLAADGPRTSPREAAADLAHRWSDLGLDPAGLAGLVVTPACGLAGIGAAEAADRQRAAIEVARRLDEATTG